MPLSDIGNQITIGRDVNTTSALEDSITKRKRSDVEKSVVQVSRTSVIDPDDEAQKWKEMFESLYAERVTAAEAQLQALTEEGIARERALKNYAHHLEGENAALKARLSSNDRTTSTGPSNAGNSEVVRLSAALQEKDALVSMYQLLTGTSISNVSKKKGSKSCDCTIRNSETKRASKFRLSPLSKETMRFEPISHAEHLPSFLHQAIDFEISQCPALMQNILSGMFPEEQSS